MWGEAYSAWLMLAPSCVYFSAYVIRGIHATPSATVICPPRGAARQARDLRTVEPATGHQNWRHASSAAQQLPPTDDDLGMHYKPEAVASSDAIACGRTTTEHQRGHGTLRERALLQSCRVLPPLPTPAARARFVTRQDPGSIQRGPHKGLPVRWHQWSVCVDYAPVT